jgi:glycosyltransferase involved in cell wall biosynthesis
MLAGAAAIHCTSRLEADDLRPPGLRRKAIVIPLGVTVPVSGGAATAAASPYLLALGRIHPKKGLDLLIRAFSQAVAANRGFDAWRLLIAGSGDSAYVASLSALAQSCGAGHRVQFTGWIAGSERESTLRGAALLAMPSHQENFGFAAFEAMARGVPVAVASSTDFAEEIASAGAGWISEANDRHLATVLADAMRNPDERLRRGNAGRALVERRFTWERVALDLKTAYAGVIQTAS